MIRLGDCFAIVNSGLLQIQLQRSAVDLAACRRVSVSGSCILFLCSGQFDVVGIGRAGDIARRGYATRNKDDCKSAGQRFQSDVHKTAISRLLSLPVIFVLRAHVSGVDDDAIDDEFDTAHAGRNPLGEIPVDAIINRAAEHGGADIDGDGKIESMQLRISAKGGQDLHLEMGIADRFADRI